MSGVYKQLFGGVVEKVRNFGGLSVAESDIEIISTLRHQGILEGNTTVVYRHDANNQLPEHYNGLGYMNLISMIFEIEILIQEFKREKESRPADINLLFIEEPEAHTHPQMQCIFIKNIKKLIREGIKRADGESRPLQYVISTHSSHIVADSDFDDIKYLKREAGGVVAKNLSDRTQFPRSCLRVVKLTHVAHPNHSRRCGREAFFLVEADRQLPPAAKNSILDVS